MLAERIERQRPSDQSEVLRQHRRLRQVVDRLRLIAWAPPGGIRPSSLSVLLRGEIEDFRDGLAVHFAFEEKGGYFGDLRETRPELTSRIAALEAEHSQMLGAIDDLLTGYEAHEVHWVKDRLLHVLDMLKRHERDEDSFLQQAMLLDIGGSD